MTQEKIQQIYKESIQLRDSLEVKYFLEQKAKDDNISMGSLYNRIYYYCRKNNLQPINVIVKRECSKKLNKIIADNPTNVTECIHEYIKKYYPEYKNKESKEYKRVFYRISHFWYSYASKRSVCFMMASKKGYVNVNRKKTDTANKSYKKNFLQKLSTKIKNLFKSI